MTAPKIFDPDYYTRMHALEQCSWWNAGMRDIAERLLRESNLPARGLLLDVGCGSGQTMCWFRQRWPQWKTVGLDVARPGLTAARHGGGEQVLGASALELPVPTASVDAVITLDVLQHLPLGYGDVQALREIHRVLRPGGMAFVRTNAQSWPRADDDPVYSFHKYSRPELQRKFTATGFRVHRLGQLNVLLGLAEIPRDLRARRTGGHGYHGLLAGVHAKDAMWRAKRGWLNVEGRAVAAGLSFPLGRTLVAIVEALPAGGRP